MNQKFKAIVFSVLIVLSLFLPAYSQDGESTEETNIEEELNQVLDSLSSLNQELRKNKSKRPVSKKIRLIKKGIIRAVNSTPPGACMEILRAAMDNFYNLVGDLISGISCGPNILPPFLPGEDSSFDRKDLNIDCIPPEFDESLERLQIGGPFGGSFTNVNPVYEQCKEAFKIDKNENDISDVCE